MLKKVFIIFLAFCLGFPLFPITQAAEPEPLEMSLEAQFDAYTASLFQENAASDALAQLLEPALSGLEKTVYFGEKDPVTSAIFHADLFRTYILDVLPQFLACMESEDQLCLLAGGDVGWHDYTLDYHAQIFEWNDTPDTTDDQIISKLFYRQNVSCNPNECDEVLSLMVGSARVRIQIEKGPIDFFHSNYRLTFTVSDDFNFDGDYEEEKDQGFDTGFSDDLNNLGTLWGLYSFTWYATAGFDIAIPNNCSHNITLLPHTGDRVCTLCGAKDPMSQNGPLPGDADGNGTLNYNDALLVLRCAINLETLSPMAALSCDLDGDGKLTYNDSLMILRRSIELE